MSEIHTSSDFRHVLYLEGKMRIDIYKIFLAGIDIEKNISCFCLQDKSLSGSLTEEEKEIRRERIARMRRKMTQKHKLVAHSTAMESIQAQTDPIDGEDNLP